MNPPAKRTPRKPETASGATTSRATTSRSTTSRVTSRQSPAKIENPSRKERGEVGNVARVRVPLDSQAEFVTCGRSDPIELLESQVATRVPELVPIRYGRMVASPIAFYRGAALVMAADLARTPNSGWRCNCAATRT